MRDNKMTINKCSDKKKINYEEKGFKCKGDKINKGNTLLINSLSGINFDMRFNEGMNNHKEFNRIMRFWDLDSDTIVYRFNTERPVMNESEKDYRIEYIFDEKLAKSYLLN